MILISPFRLEIFYDSSHFSFNMHLLTNLETDSLPCLGYREGERVVKIWTVWPTALQLWQDCLGGYSNSAK